MKTDRELLESAAKANWQADLANEEVSLRYSESDEGILYLHADNQDHNGRDREFVWNPLTDDGDALRLAAKLKIDIDWQDTKSFPEPNVEAYRSNGDEGCFCATEHEDDYRRAIVRAAANIATKET